MGYYDIIVHCWRHSIGPHSVHLAAFDISNHLLYENLSSESSDFPPFSLDAAA